MGGAARSAAGTRAGPRRSPLRLLKRYAAIALLTIGYGAALLVSSVLPRPRYKAPVERQRILLIGTFHNPNWFYAHVVPLVSSGVAEVLLVGEGHMAEIPRLRVLSPPAWANRLFTRAGAKFLFSLRYAFQYRPGLYMGYAIFPAATTALILGRLFRRPASFQVTSGPLELAGGGFAAENKALASLGWPSPWIEKLAHALTARFDLLVVRGSQAFDYVRALGETPQIETITGSIVLPERTAIDGERDIDVVYVGRLSERKRPERFIEGIAALKEAFPEIRAAMIGDGPKEDEVRALIPRFGLERNVEMLGLRDDVEALLLRSKIFWLTSRWEGVSIAMLEAMGAGAVPVVYDVGDLADVVESGKNGYVDADDDLEAAVAHVAELLRDDGKRQAFSHAAYETSLGRAGRDAIAARWNAAFGELFDGA